MHASLLPNYYYEHLNLNYYYYTLLLCICMYIYYLANVINIYTIAVCVNDTYVRFTILHNYSIVMYGRYMNAYY